MDKPRCIRIFETYKEAFSAQELLKGLRIESKITRDRFRLYISEVDIIKASRFLAIEIRKTRLNK